MASPDEPTSPANLARRLAETRLLTRRELRAARATSEAELLEWVRHHAGLPDALVDRVVAREELSLGRYQVTGRVGRGGMGVVLCARDPALGRDVALKVLPPAAGEAELARLRREARALAALNHPHIVRIYDLDEVDDTSFLVMELVDGPSLARRLKDGTLSEDEAWLLLEHAADALTHAERQGIVHRDLKPGNVLCARDGEQVLFRLCDFGIAKRARADEGSLTQTGSTLGTPSYMSPEQARGEPLDARSDMYSLGLTLIEALTGKVPFEEGDPAMAVVLTRRLRLDVPDVRKLRPEVSAELAGVIQQLTARERSRRPASWADVLARARRRGAAAAVSRSGARRGAALARSGLGPLRAARPALGPWIGAGVALLVALLVFDLGRGTPPTPTPERADARPPAGDDAPPPPQPNGPSAPDPAAEVQEPPAVPATDSPLARPPEAAAQDVVGPEAAVLTFLAVGAHEAPPEALEAVMDWELLAAEPRIEVDAATLAARVRRWLLESYPIPIPRDLAARSLESEVDADQARVLLFGNERSAFRLARRAGVWRITDFPGLAEAARSVPATTEPTETEPTATPPPEEPPAEAPAPPAAEVVEAERDPEWRQAFPERLAPREVRREGGSEETEAAVGAALQWLVRHQHPDGRWDVKDWRGRCRGIGCVGGGEHDLGDARYEVGVTALAILALLGQGHAQAADGPLGAAAARGLRWLRERQHAEGWLGYSAGHEEWIYNQAIATLALSEGYGLTGDPTLKDAARRAIEACVRCQNPGLGWKYGIRTGRNDTSVTGWMTQVLRTAAQVGLPAPQSAAEGALAWFERATDDEGSTGYETPGGGSSFFVGRDALFDRFPVMTAVALLGRLELGERRSHPQVRAGIKRVAAAPPRWEPRAYNFYYWYYGSYALFQASPTSFRRWNEALHAALLPAQVKGACADGSWDPVGEWCGVGGRVYATALNALTLEVYYRYPRR